MCFRLTIPSRAGERELNVPIGSTVLLVGANGSGKSRLAGWIEGRVGAMAHRISAHRALKLNPGVPKISEADALIGLRTGYPSSEADVEYRLGNRWHMYPVLSMLDDFDFVLQALFAEQANTALDTHRRALRGELANPEATKFDQLLCIWSRLLSHRVLRTTSDGILATTSLSGSVGTRSPEPYSGDEPSGESSEYSASELSDGERSVFYLVAQALLAAPGSLIIVDEPELHISRSILSALWDEIESARPDCAFLLITHDLDFAAQRSSVKYLLSDYSPLPTWEISDVPDGEFDEDVVVSMLGPRRPVLFVEGRVAGFDSSVYRAVFPNWTVVPRKSCAEVIHSVRSLRENEMFTRVNCVGLVDKDGKDVAEQARLNEMGVWSLPVSEVENLFLLTDVAREIAKVEGFTGRHWTRSWPNYGVWYLLVLQMIS